MTSIAKLGIRVSLVALTVAMSVGGCSCSSPGGPADGSVDGSGGSQDGGVDGATPGDGGGDASTADGSTSDGSTVIVDGGVVLLDAGDGGTTECYVKVCIDSQGREIHGQCGDCLDNDSDGLADERDPECLNYCDDHEATFSFFDPSTGGGDTNSCNLDCYYDHDVGFGNDGCRWNGRCDMLEPDPLCTYNAGTVGSNSCPNSQSPACAINCRPLVPNGCDCFGCCELPAGSNRFVFIGTGAATRTPTCTLEAAEAQDDDACAPCTPRLGDDNCYNSCQRCELCLGKTVDDLPCDCFTQANAPARCVGIDAGVPDGGTPDGGTTPDGGVPYECPGGAPACDFPGLPPCPGSSYCLTGCCLSVIFG
ncbi:MAG: hypothetical protein R3B40_01890 [Polyangiales bacterium]|nr:hypothetical protein [Myxococcales bacterium]MCB9658806.1 hypothetical protein [Sandaracinaceae bacterium]